MAKRDGVIGMARGRRGMLALVVAGAVLAGCSSDGSDGATPPTIGDTAPMSTIGAEPPETTVDDGPVPTTPEGVPTEPEDLAVAFVRAASNGDDLSAFVRDPAVIEAAAALESGPEAAGWTYRMDPEYLDPMSQGGAGGDCQLVGDVTLSCAVRVERPAAGGEEASATLWAVQITNIDPAAEGPVDEFPPVPFYVTGIEGLAG